MIGRRILPCGHQRARGIPDAAGVHERTCATCHREFYAIVRHNAYWSGRLGQPTFMLTWRETPGVQGPSPAATAAS